MEKGVCASNVVERELAGSAAVCRRYASAAARYIWKYMRAALNLTVFKFSKLYVPTFRVETSITQERLYLYNITLVYHY